MLKRASLARALDPALLFLDEPTSGLDPVSAESVDNLVLALRDLFRHTIFMITRDLDLLWHFADRVGGAGRRQGAWRGFDDGALEPGRTVDPTRRTCSGST